MNENRIVFKDLPRDENRHFFIAGMNLYKVLRMKYPNESDKHLDKVLNVLCATMFCMIKLNVDKENYTNVIHLAHQILDKNLKVLEDLPK